MAIAHVPCTLRRRIGSSKAFHRLLTVRGLDRRLFFLALIMLPLDEAIESITDHAFAALGDRPRYERDGVETLQTFLR